MPEEFDASSYYFPSQNRFVPSSSSFPRQQSGLSGYRSANSGFSPAPGSYQEQLLFIGNENNGGNTGAVNKQTGSAPYGSPFGSNSQFVKTNRQTEYYDISPRPFGVPVAGGGAVGVGGGGVATSATPTNGFIRSKAIRNGSSIGNGLGNSLNGFQPQTQSQRVNVPHQQTQFLAHFNEPAANEKRLPSSSSAALRPFGNGGFSPSATRTRQPAPPAAAVEDATPQAASTPYRLRNRYQPGSSTPSTTSTTTGSSAEVSSKRYNRFGSHRGVAKVTSSTTASSASSTSERPSFGRKAANPRRPVFISREINEPVSVVSKRPFNYNSANARLKLPRPTPSTTSTTESQEEEEAELEEQEEVVEQESQAEQEESTSLEKLPLQEETITPISIAKTEAINSQEHTSEGLDTVTSNEAELDKSTSTTSTEEAQTDSSETSDFAEETTLPNAGQEYEYVEEEADKEKATTAIPRQHSESTEEQQTEEQQADTTETLWEESTSEAAPPKQQQEEETHQEIKTTAKQQEQPEYDDEEVGETEEEEYEYDEEEEGEGEEKDQEESESDATTELENESTSSRQQKVEDGREIISVVTTKSVVNGSTAYPAPVTPRSQGTTLADIQPAPQPQEEEQETHTEATIVETTPTPSENVTESYVVVASIQTSRSINGARFLPFPAIEQEETKHTLSELERKVHSKQQQKQLDINESSEEPSTTSTPTTSSSTTTSTSTTEKSLGGQEKGASTESIIDKLDRVQSELSSGVLSGKYPIINQMDAAHPTQATTTSTGSGRFVPNIRKFQPRTTAAPSTTSSGAKVKVQHFDESEMDELAGLLPVGFKPKSSYKNRKITTSTTTTEKPSEDLNRKQQPARNSTISRSFKNGVVAVQDVALAGLLPKGYKPPKTTTTKPPPLESLFSKAKFEDSLSALLPKDYKLNSSTTKPEISIVDDISKFLPPGFSDSTTAKSTTTTKTTSSTQRSPAVAVPFDDLSSFLPPGYKPPKEETESKLPSGITTLKVDDLSSFLPPGFKLNDTVKTSGSESDDLLASLLPKDYKSKTLQHPASTSTSKPKSTAPTAAPAPVPAAASTEATGGFKVVFPKGIHKRLGAHRLTTPHPTVEGAAEGSPSAASPSLVIRKGPPMRATTEFTGWPTPPTTPLSIDKLNAQTINFEDLLTAAGTSSTTTTTTSTTTTTTTTTPRPTKPGHCTADCDLEATIRIVDGVAWKPELLDHNTLEWKTLAHELEAQLNEVYSNANQLSKWYKKVRIDSFSEGSVLVDYYVELANITEDVDTLEIKQLFHDALSKPTMLPDKDAQENETDSVASPQEEQLVKASYQMGKFIIDPVATEFSVIAKNLHTNVENAEDDLPIPQWAIVVIVIGVGSLVFVVIFGVTVLLNRQKRAKKTPIPLTNDMLNELKVNHMGGADNYGVDDFYNIDDPWNDTKQPIKPKRFTNSMHGSNSSNIYDSWRSTRHGHTSGDYFYDQQPTYSQKGDSLKRPHLGHHHHHQQQQQQHQPYAGHQQQSQQGYGHGHQYPDAFADAHQMYSYNNHASRTRYARDYDPDF